MRFDSQTLFKALFDFGLIAFQDKSSGKYFLLDKEIRQFSIELDDLHSLIIQVETSGHFKSQKVINYLNDYWENHFFPNATYLSEDAMSLEESSND